MYNLKPMSINISHNTAARTILNFLKGLQSNPEDLPESSRVYIGFANQGLTVATAKAGSHVIIPARDGKPITLSFAEMNQLDQVFAANGDQLGQALTNLHKARDQSTVAALIPTFEDFDSIVRDLVAVDLKQVAQERQPEHDGMGAS